MAPSAAPCDVKVTRASLEGDGVGDRLFELLWKRDLFSDSSLEMRIPDTVVFRYGAPLVWYFTSLDGTVKRKTKAKVNSERIFEEFVKRASPSGILASYVSSIRSDDEPEPGPDAIEDFTAGTKTTIEYLNRDELWHVLFNRQKVRPDGILQKFVEPKGDHNNMIRVLWSPKVCLLERRVNNKRLSDTKYDVYERAVTFEGSEFLSEVTPVRGPTMVMQVHDIADAIVQHIAAVTGDRMKISRMALNFKVDERDRLWLLFASSLRLRGDHASDLMENGITNTPLEANTVLQVPDHVRRIGTTMMSRPAALQCSCRCPTCADKVQGGELCDVSYKVIIEYEERRRGVGQPLPAALWPQWPPTEACPGANRDFRATGVDEPEPELRDRFLQVPEPLQLLHPRLTSDEYARFRHDVVFLYKVASVCEACYLRFSAPQLGSQWKQTVLGLGSGDSEDFENCAPSTRPQGTQALDPNRLRKRQHVTQRRVLDQKVCEDVQFEAQLRCRAEKLQPKRAQSCPKLLPSWGAGHKSKVCSNPPAPVLGDRPWPPQGAAPLWAAVGRSAPHYSMEISPQRRRRVPKLLGAPYLKDLQAFAVNCPSRAHSVVPSMPPRSMPVHTGAKNRSSGSRHELATTSAAIAVPAVASSAAAEVPEMRAAKLRLRPSSADDDSETEGLNASARPLFLDDDSDDGGVLEDAGADDADSLVAKLWEQWPESCGAGGASSATTTRPPSAADGFRTSSYPSSTTADSRNSSRPMSRLMSAQSKSRPSRPQSAAVASRAANSSRPLSSPLLRGSMGHGAEQGALHRPASSPQIRPGLPRPSALHGTSPEKRVAVGASDVF